MSRFKIAFAVALGCVVPAAAHGQELCPTESSWVTRTPRWWDAPGDPSEWDTRPRSDPGWTGSAQGAFGDGMTGRGIFRAIYGSDATVSATGKVLFLSWQMDVGWFGTDTCGNPNARLYFGVAPGAATDFSGARFFRIDVRSRASAVGASGNALACDKRVLADQTVPECLNGAPVCDASGTDTPGGTTYTVYEWNATTSRLESNEVATKAADFMPSYGRIWVEAGGPWTIQLAIPVGHAHGVPTGTDFKIYFESRNCTTDSCIIEQWPRRDAGESHFVAQPSFAIVTPPDLAQWGSLKLGGTCTGGIDFLYQDAGAVTDPALVGGATDTSDPASYSFDFEAATLNSTIVGKRADGTAARNVFVARPWNRTATPIGVGELTARFRIADWGSQADIGSDRGAWSDIPGEPAPPANTVANKIAIPANGKKPILYQWELTQQERCDYGLETIAGTTCGTRIQNDQCLLVELRSTKDVDFIRDSLYRNMRFVNASLFEDEAVIDTKGVKPLAGGGPRTIYLHVLQRQMDLVRPGGYVPAMDAVDRLNARMADFKAGQGQGLPPGLAEAAKRVNNALDGRRERLAEDVKLRQTIFDQLRTVPPDELRSIMPTVEYSVFHESDLQVDEEGTKFKVANPQTGFGYFAVHVGGPQSRVHGWAHALGGQLERISDNFYRLRIPPGKDRATLETRIQALEDPREHRIVDRLTPAPGPGTECPECPKPCEECPACPRPWWPWLVALLSAIVAAIAGYRIARK